ncbi:hypothetical protein HYW35_01900 [Candidatus Saccharibacteria bacterium]|nr:hypothetical protein [Candidatus Saccharibacteria bacterium]
MSVVDFFESFIEAFRKTRVVVRLSFKSLRKDPQILVYPYLAVSFILLTSPIVSGIVLSIWRRLDQPAVVAEVTQKAPDVFLAKVGLVSFSVFYAAFITSYFIVAMSAGALAKLENRPTSLLYGLRQVFKHFFRVSQFALLAIFFLPLGVAAQYRKLRSPKALVEIIGSSFSLNMAQLAPAVLSTEKSLLAIVRHSINTLGQAWRENLIIKGGMYLTFLLLASVSFLPKVIEHYWFEGRSAQIISWIATALLGVTSYVAVKVIGAVFTTTLYHQAKKPDTKT